MRRYLDAPRPMAFAHRGGAKLWPENTLAAFRGARELGYRYIETDAHLTRDGAIVLLHDDTVERTTDGRGAVAAHTLAELRRLDAGYWFTEDGHHYPWRGRGVRIPTLDEALALDPELRFNVELKPRDPHLAKVLWRFIEDRDCADRLLVASARTDIVRTFRRLCGGRVATSAGKREVFAFWLAVRAGVARFAPLDYDALQVPERQGRLRVVDRRFLKAAHRRGLHVHVWTVDAPEAIARLKTLDVDGIMTDRPDRLPP